MYSQLRRCHGLDSLELKALSVPSSLRFLLGIEYDVVLCVTEVGSRRPFTLHFPVFAETFRKLLSLCAMRFSLECTHSEDGSSVLSGAAVMPLLRYADYLPGALHVEELLECLQVAPSATPKRREGASASDFEASFLDYAEFTSEASLNDVHGLGFYLTLDYGLSLASHGHLVDIRFHEDWNPKEAIREFQEFSGWETFDLRFYDDHNKKEGGVIVFPTIQDVCDLLEKYEDEDSDDEGDLLPFILRPVAALIPVPSIEDSVLRKQREQNWSEIVQFWERFPRTKNTVVVYNLFDGATLPDVLAFMEGLAIEKSCLVEDHSPQKRRRAFVTFADASSTKKALELDGRSTKGRTLRVQVSPPYINDERRGTEVKETAKTKVRGGTGKRSTSGAGQGSPTTKPTTSNGGATAGKQSAAPEVGGAGAVKAATQQKERNAKPADGKHSGAKVEDSGANHTGASQSTTSAAPIGTTAPTAAPPAIPLPASQAGSSSSVKALEHAWASAALAHGRPSAASAAPTAATAVGSSPLVVPAPSSATEKHHLQIPAPASAAKAKEGGSTRPTSASASPSLMNAEAKEFVPSFRLNVNSPEFRPELPPPPSYTDPAFLLDADLLPPPAVPPPPPPSYSATAGLAPPPPPHGCYTVAPPRPRSATASAHLTYEDAGGPPPLFTMPPPYNPSAAGLPPPPPPPY